MLQSWYKRPYFDWQTNKKNISNRAHAKDLLAKILWEEEMLRNDCGDFACEIAFEWSKHWRRSGVCRWTACKPPLPAVLPNLFAFILLRQFAFRKLAIVRGDTVPTLQPSSQQVNLSESTSLLSCSSLLNLQITSSPCISE